MYSHRIRRIHRIFWWDVLPRNTPNSQKLLMRYTPTDFTELHRCFRLRLLRALWNLWDFFCTILLWILWILWETLRTLTICVNLWNLWEYISAEWNLWENISAEWNLWERSALAYFLPRRYLSFLTLHISRKIKNKIRRRFFASFEHVRSVQA